MQRRGKNTSKNREIVRRRCFLCGSCRDVISRIIWSNELWLLSRWTVILRVVGGDKKGSLESEIVKYGRKSQGTWTRERLHWQGPAAYTKDRPVLSSDRAPHKKHRTCQTIIHIWSWAPHGARHEDLLTDWPSVAKWLWLWNELVVRIERDSLEIAVE
jgi:hypothetical protein